MSAPMPGRSAVVRTLDHTVLFDVMPATAGPNTVAITVLRADGTPAAVRSWTGTAVRGPTGPAGSGSARVAVPIALTPFRPGVSTAAPELGAGRWTMRVTIRAADGTTATFTKMIPVAAG